MNTYSQITTETVGDITIVNFVASRVLDPMMIEEIGKELQSLFDDHPGGKFILELKDVEFLSSAVLNRLIVLDKSVKSTNGTMAFCCLRPAVSEVFGITKLDLLFKIYLDRDEAIQSLQ